MQIIERTEGHYDVLQLEFGTVYRWCPKCVVLECSNCAKKMTLTRSELIKAKPECECGRGHTARVREEVVIELVDEDYEAHRHPWRHWHTTKETGITF